MVLSGRPERPPSPCRVACTPGILRVGIGLIQAVEQKAILFAGPGKNHLAPDSPRFACADTGRRYDNGLHAPKVRKMTVDFRPLRAQNRADLNKVL